MIARPIGLAVALLLVAPTLLLAQPAKPSRLTGPLVKTDDRLSVNGVSLANGPLLALLRPLEGKNVTLRGIVTKDDAGERMSVESVKAVNPSNERHVDILRGPEEGAVVMKTVEPGHGIQVIGRSRNGAWLKVRVDENDDEFEPGWVKAGDLVLGSDAPGGVNAKRKISGLVAASERGVTVNGVKVTNEPFVQILRRAAGKNVTVEGFLSRPAPGDEIRVTSFVAQNDVTRRRALKIRQNAEDGAPQLGAPVAAGQPLQVTGMTADGKWFTTVVAEGDMRETGYVKATEVTVGSAPAPTPGVTGSIRIR